MSDQGRNEFGMVNRCLVFNILNNMVTHAIFLQCWREYNGLIIAVPLDVFWCWLTTHRTALVYPASVLSLSRCV